MSQMEMAVRNSAGEPEYLGLLVREVGVGNIVEELYPLEWMAHDAAATLWASWVLFRVHPTSGLTHEASSGGIGFGHEAIRRHVYATQQHAPLRSHLGQPSANGSQQGTVQGEEAVSSAVDTADGKQAAASTAPAPAPRAFAALSTSANGPSGGILEGWLEKKPVHGLGMLSRTAGLGGWRPRRVVLRPQSLEWHHGGDDDSGELQVLLLHSTASRVRAAGEAGDDPERCLTVSGTVDGYSVTLVLRCSDTVERDQWLRATCRCIESLKSMAFDVAVSAAEKRLNDVESEHGRHLRGRHAVREGAKLLMERFFSSSTVIVGGEESFDLDLPCLADALASCLLTRQAEKRILMRIGGGFSKGGGGDVGDGKGDNSGGSCRGGGGGSSSSGSSGSSGSSSGSDSIVGESGSSRGETSGEDAQDEEELRSLRLFSWQPEVAKYIEESALSLVRAWGGAASLASVAVHFDWALGISESFALSAYSAAHEDCGPWASYRDCVHAVVMRRLILLAINPPRELFAFLPTLEAQYTSIRTLQDAERGTQELPVYGGSASDLTAMEREEAAPPNGSERRLPRGGPAGGSVSTRTGILGASDGTRCAVLRRIEGSKTKPLLIELRASDYCEEEDDEEAGGGGMDARIAADGQQEERQRREEEEERQLALAVAASLELAAEGVGSQYLLSEEEQLAWALKASAAEAAAVEGTAAAEAEAEVEGDEAAQAVRDCGDEDPHELAAAAVGSAVAREALERALEVAKADEETAHRVSRQALERALEVVHEEELLKRLPPLPDEIDAIDEGGTRDGSADGGGASGGSGDGDGGGGDGRDGRGGDGRGGDGRDGDPLGVMASNGQGADAAKPLSPSPQPPRRRSESPRLRTARYIFKRGDDLMQDVLVLMMLSEINLMWRESGASAFTLTYNVVPSGERSGFIEVLPNATPIKRVSDFRYSKQLHASAVGAFIAGFVLGLADRHQDNMLLVGPDQDLFAHIDFGYVAGARPWFDANLLPIPERFYRCLVAAGKWADFVNDCAFAFTVLQAKRTQLFAVAKTFVEPLLRVGYPEYIDNVLRGNTVESVRALVEAAPSDLARRFKNLHHSWSH